MSITAITLCKLGLITNQVQAPVATINGEALTAQNYHRRMEYLPGLGRKTSTGQFIEILPAIATLDTLVTEMLLLQIAKAKGLTPTETEIDQELSYRVRNDSNYVGNWLTIGRTMTELRQMLKVERAHFKIQTEGIVVTETDIQKAYDAAKPSRYTIPNRVKLRVITVTDEESKSKVDDGLKAGKTFESLATQYSTDASKTFGGDFGVVPIEALGEQVQAGIKTLKKGERTGWLAADKVYAKFQVDAIMPMTIVPLDAKIKEDIRRDLMLLRGAPKVDMVKLLREARQTASISITSPEINKAYKQFVDLEKSARPGG